MRIKDALVIEVTLLLLLLMLAVIALFSLLASGSGGTGSYTFLEAETEGDEFDLNAVVKGLGVDGKGGQLKLAFCWQGNGDHYYLHIAQGKLTFHRVKGNTDETLGLVGTLPAVSDSFRLKVKRRAWWMAALVNQALVARAVNDEFAQGKVGWWVDGEAKLEVIRFQRVEPVMFSDDFMRSGDDLGSWSKVSGNWTNTIHGDPTLSANPFTFKGSADGVGLLTAGYTFWDSYIAEVSAIPSDTGTFGLAVCYHDDASYYLFRWTSALSKQLDADRKQFLRVSRDKREVLAEASGGHLPNQWYRIQVRFFQGLFIVSVDDREVFRLRDTSYAEGQVALYVERTGGVYFDDALVKSWALFEDDFSQFQPRTWLTVDGSSQVHEGHLILEPSQFTKKGWVVTGHLDWRNYIVITDAILGEGTVGLIGAWRDAGNYVALRVGMGKSSKPKSTTKTNVTTKTKKTEKMSKITQAAESARAVVELVSYLEGSSSTLDRQAIYASTAQWHRLALSVENGHIIGYIDGLPVVEGYAPMHEAGKAGLLTTGKKAAFDLAYVIFIERKPTEANVTPQFTREVEYMASWATPQGMWVPVEPGSDASPRRYKGQLFGDCEVEMKLPKGFPPHARLLMSLGHEEASVRKTKDEGQKEKGKEDERGYTLLLRREADRLHIEIIRQSDVVAHKEMLMPSLNEDHKVRFARRGAFLIVSLDDRLVMSYRCPPRTKQ